jgi:hypothetical protein
MSGPARRAPGEPAIAGRDAERGLLAGFLDGGPASAAILTGAEANLARVYRKLAITSRAELGARMGPPRP